MDYVGCFQSRQPVLATAGLSGVVKLWDVADSIANCEALPAIQVV